MEEIYSIINKCNKLISNHIITLLNKLNVYMLNIILKMEKSNIIMKMEKSYF